MKLKTVAFMIVLILAAGTFAVTSTLPVMDGDNPSLDPVIVEFFRPPSPCAPIPGGPGST